MPKAERLRRPEAWRPARAWRDLFAVRPGFVHASARCGQPDGSLKFHRTRKRSVRLLLAGFSDSAGEAYPMARKSSVLEFRRQRRRFVAPGPVRGNKLRFSRKGGARARVIGPAGGLAICTAICLLLFACVMFWDARTAPGKSDLHAAAPVQIAPGQGAQDRQHTSNSASLPVAFVRETDLRAPVSIRWVDGDSGWINGRAFRLYGVDAPEGSPSRADCQAERARSAQAKDAARALTNAGTVEVRGSMGTDKYGRDLLLLTVDGKDVAGSLVGRGHLQYWAYEAGQDKPDWCG